MSSVIVANYSFDASEKKITFRDYDSIRLEGIKLITNVTTGDVVYQFNKAEKSGAVASNILTLDHDTTAMSDADKLMIIYEEPGQGLLGVVSYYFRQISEYLRIIPDLIQSGNGGLLKFRAMLATDSSIGTVSNVSAVSTVTTVANIVNLNNIDAREQIWAEWNVQYNSGIRSKIL